MPAETIIFVDTSFVIIFLMDYLILWAAARIARVYCRWWRLALGAAGGAVYNIITLLPGMGWLGGAAMEYLLVPLLMIALAFSPLHLRQFASAFVSFYLIFINMIGVSLVILYLFNSSSSADLFGKQPLSYLWLAVPLADALLVGKYGVPLLRRAFMKELQRVPVEIRFQGKELRVDGMVDTGNQLIDPLTGAPVIIVEYGVFEQLLPDSLGKLVAANEPDLGKLVLCRGADGKPLPFRLIPFNTIGKQHGMLVGLKPDGITLLSGERKVIRNDVIVGLYNRKLSPQGSYRALLHPDLINIPA